ncbi:MAG: AI-2E family transporter [Sphingobacteriia bacterium]|nr:AI-2E family transporter [Sphingobacteriia bacterium]NCC40659.1 AI-2E family transporter [Gammaproteobacteria bacterium]
MPEDSQVNRFFDQTLESFIRIALLILMLIWCYQIIAPFLIPIAWAVIIALGLHPVYRVLVMRLGGRRILGAVIISLLCFVLLLIPAILLGGSVVDETHLIIERLGRTSLDLPDLPTPITAVPLIGDDVARFWEEANSNLRAFMAEAAPLLKLTLHWLIRAASGFGLALLHILLAILIAGVLLANAERARDLTHALARRLADERGVEFARIAEATIWSVIRGVLGIALIQSLLAGLGWLAVGVPAAGLWALLALIMCVLQIGLLPLTLVILVYVFFHVETLTFALFLIWSLFVYGLDHVLKPLLLGRGVDVPMVVVFVGAIGGFIRWGIVGLFVGAVVLVLGYRLFIAWLHARSAQPSSPAP